jgi:hypothetical protein
MKHFAEEISGPLALIGVEFDALNHSIVFSVCKAIIQAFNGRKPPFGRMEEIDRNFTVVTQPFLLEQLFHKPSLCQRRMVKWFLCLSYQPPIAILGMFFAVGKHTTNML